MSLKPIKSSGTAALLSLIIPGAGHMYKDRIGEGLGWLVFVCISYAFFIIPGLILHLICILSAASETQEELDNRVEHEKRFSILNAAVNSQTESPNFETVGKKFSNDIKKHFDLLQRGLIDQVEFETNKRTVMNSFQCLRTRPDMADFLTDILPLIDSGAITKDEIDQIKNLYKSDLKAS